MKMLNSNEIFENIYEKNLWGCGSGTGSLPKYNKGYIKFIENFIKKHDIKSVVDFGCGDWQFSKFINWNNANYLGYDVAPFVIENNIKQYKKENIDFAYTPDNWEDVKGGDLLICKDVLQHLENKNIKAFVENVLPKFKYALITNCVIPVENRNIEIQTGHFHRPVDLRCEPYNIYMERVYKYPIQLRNEVKYTLLYDKQALPKDMACELEKEANERKLIESKYKFLDLLSRFFRIVCKEKNGNERTIYILGLIKIRYTKKNKR